jgi:hypothetical protein
MVQSLLADRFMLKLNQSSKELQIYALELTKKKLIISQSSEPSALGAGKQDPPPDNNQHSASPLADSFRSSIFTAIQERVRLKLESAKSPVKILVISLQRANGRASNADCQMRWLCLPYYFLDNRHTC